MKALLKPGDDWSSWSRRSKSCTGREMRNKDISVATGKAIWYTSYK